MEAFPTADDADLDLSVIRVTLQAVATGAALRQAAPSWPSVAAMNTGSTAMHDRIGSLVSIAALARVRDLAIVDCRVDGRTA